MQKFIITLKNISFHVFDTKDKDDACSLLVDDDAIITIHTNGTIKCILKIVARRHCRQIYFKPSLINIIFANYHDHGVA